MTVLDRLAARLREEGGLVADVLLEAPQGQATHGARALRGPHGAGREEELELVVEAVREGYLLHYGDSRLLDTSDADLALLAGDRLYALGLALLADAGDLASVAELSDVITLAAAAHARAQPSLADAVWAAGSEAVGAGPLPGHADAKAAARRGDPGAEAALRAVARQLSCDVAP
ncbi:MAG: hypothetical protein H0V81_04140 [Solirubrobacterales bacterium]|nr:hypothetical protein [Solirubrobacterales bacterium]